MAICTLVSFICLKYLSLVVPLYLGTKLLERNNIPLRKRLALFHQRKEVGKKIVGCKSLCIVIKWKCHCLGSMVREKEGSYLSY